jgi:phage gp29-like protein
MAWWLMRGLGRDWFGRFMERYGAPFPIAHVSAQDPQAVAFMREAFSNFSKIGGLIIDRDDKVELESAIVHGGAEGHKLWHDVCNDAISFAITGYKSSQKPQGLNAGDSAALENIRDDIRIFDQKRLSETLQRQPFARLLQINGCAGNIRIIWGGLSDDDAATFATLLKTMGEAGYEVMEESLPTIEERTGLQWRKKASVPGPMGKILATDEGG